jgi:hypothetical protein
MTYTQEIWRPVPGYEGYEASNLGRVRSLDRWLEKKNRVKCFQRGRVLRQPPDHGYPRTKLGYVHTFVMLAFCGPPPDGMVVAHNDGNPLNNKLDNLRYATPSDNAMDRVAHGTANRGSRNGFAKLTEQQVLAIRSSIGKSQTALAREFGVSLMCVNTIVNRTRWAWL